MQGMVDVVRELLVELMTMCGFALDPNKTPIPSPSQTLLGIHCQLTRSARRGKQHLQLLARLDDRKATYWKQLIDEVLETGFLDRRTAERKPVSSNSARIFP